MHYSVHPPSKFIDKYCDQLLPTWSTPVRSIVVILQPAELELTHCTPAAEHCKHRLRQRFLDIGLAIIEHLKQLGYLADGFDPKTGLPLTSQAGFMRLDDVAVVRSSLGYPAAQLGACSTLVHPLWGSAVYPSILMSSADTKLVESAVRAVAGLLECHHSLSG
ncbi:methylmalonic aciduria and homocystinuria type D protein [Myxacorys almedinensis]|uniref:Methylmalonic aciduria and homocystinuria type D protein n=1 Tax=Myxacorys almedinensis A TaxID=2690445 RepID=A0A8J7YZE6_9CYAN|nr:methylmalonic aciduria and homocystinuria type D protein [Myxacorys almedinensis]NDJ17347.1 methylmalonic aciduria and homocystinuria type D protein [Myxacorys almedinensis A]